MIRSTTVLLMCILNLWSLYNIILDYVCSNKLMLPDFICPIYGNTV